MLWRFQQQTGKEKAVKGIVFTEFLEMVEDEFSLEVADQIIQSAQLATDGAYTAVGTYDHRELLRLIAQLEGHAGEEASRLLCRFGEHLFGRFHVGYPSFFDGISGAFDFLRKIEDYIHVEVRKLYPDAELPTFEYKSTDSRQLQMTYRSSRPLTDLAEGLIRGCARHFGEDLDIERHEITAAPETCVQFKLTQRS
jgi:hypothetical protein